MSAVGKINDLRLPCRCVRVCLCMCVCAGRCSQDVSCNTHLSTDMQQRCSMLAVEK